MGGLDIAALGFIQWMAATAILIAGLYVIVDELAKANKWEWWTG